jgi:hypothetical protein
VVSAIKLSTSYTPVNIALHDLEHRTSRVNIGIGVFEVCVAKADVRITDDIDASSSEMEAWV